MIEHFLQELWHLLGEALTLEPTIYRQLAESSYGVNIAFLIVLAAGLSQAIGQSFVLFVNRVKPWRFVLCLVIATLLFAFTYFFWVWSIWLVGRFVFRVDWQLVVLMRWVAISYAPQLFGFLVALPYFGIPLSVVISIWSLLSLVVGLQYLNSLTVWNALVCTGLGWIVLQLLQRTAGRPLIAWGRSLQNFSAGTNLITDRQSLRRMIEEGNPDRVSLLDLDWMADTQNQISSSPTRRLLKFLAIALIAFVVIGLVFGSQGWLTVLMGSLSRTARLTLNLVGISLIALFVSILLTPLEALSWWAGWTEAEPLKPGVPLRLPNPDTEITRYVIYLDGINQGSYSYLPEVDQFLAELGDTLPDSILVVRGIMPYSASNRPLSEDHPLAFLWKIIESFTQKNPNNPIGFIINLRNVFAVAVSADARYGPVLNQGLAQVLYDSLVYNGYQPESQTPITLIGNSGGGQMAMGAVTYLQETTKAPIEVISIAGVIAGNTGTMNTEHLYHLVGGKDFIEKVGPVFFPSRWAIALTSNWNRAKRRGKVSVISLGPVGHNGQTGPLGSKGKLEDGRTYLEQTLEIVTGIVLTECVFRDWQGGNQVKESNYERYRQAPFNTPEYYPLKPTVASDLYQPICNWIGRLILPTLEERHQGQGVKIQLYHTPKEQQHLLGQVVPLVWSQDPEVQSYVQLVTYDVHFEGHVELSQRQGNIHPERVNHWSKVDPLESLAGSHPQDDIIVALSEPLEVIDSQSNQPTLLISADPVHITGRYYGLVQIRQAEDNDRFRVQHYSLESQAFTGEYSTVYIPTVISNVHGVLPASNHQIDKSPANVQGWYIFGAPNDQGEFVVQAIAPYHLLALEPDEIIRGKKATLKYINYQYWQDVVAQKGQTTTTLLLPDTETGTVSHTFPEGTRTLLLHVYGGIGGEKREPAAAAKIFFGHFSYGIAQVVRDTLTDKLRFEIEYRQIYAHNTDGIISGSNHWTRYMGDRQFGWLGTRPVSEIMVVFPPLTEDYNFGGVVFSPMKYLIRELDVMAARYRLGDGTGTTIVSPVNSCVQDSSQALYTSLKRMLAEFELNPLMLKWLREHPDHEQTHRFVLLRDLIKSLEANLLPFGMVRRDWKYGDLTLGRFPGETPSQTIINALASWRTLLPRLANDVIAMIFLQLGATLWVIRTNQVGGYDQKIEPIAPTDFSFRVPKIVRSEHSSYRR